MERSVFNQAQIELLGAMSAIQSEDELIELKHAISEFFARRADAEMDKLWEDGKWNEQTLESLKSAHYRTPYRQ